MQQKGTKSFITDFTNGPVFKQLVTFALPLLLANLLQIIYNLVDMIVVGRAIGSVGLSAVSIGGDISTMLTMLVIGFANAAQVIISQFIGADKKEHISDLIGTFICFMFMCLVVLTTAALILRNDLLAWMSTPAEAWDGAYDYSVTCSAGLIFIFGYNAVSAIMRGLGDSKRPFVFIAIAAVLNIVLDLWFVLGLGLGAFGAAFATVISQAVSFISALIYIIKNKDKLGFSMSKKNLKINKELLMTLVKLGFPMALMNACVCFSRLFVNSFINSYGVIVSAASGIGTKLHNICALVSTAFNTGGASMIGQNIGAEKYDRVLKIMRSILILILIINAVFSAIMFFFADGVFALFTEEADVISLAWQYMPIAVIIFFGFAVRCPMMALINGSGNYKMNFIVAVLDALLVRIGLALLFGLSMKMDYFGFWLGDAIAGYTPVFVGLIFLSTGKWRTRKYIIRD